MDVGLVGPDPTKMLPQEGLIAVLTEAAHAYPFPTVCVVMVALLLFFGFACLTVVKVWRYKVLQDPSAAKAIQLIEKQQQNQKRAMARLKQKK